MTLIRRIPNPPNFHQGSVTRALAPHWGALLALALFLAAGFAVLDDYGAHADEFTQRQNADANLRYLADGDFGAFKSGFLIAHDKFYGMAFEAPLLLIERAFGIDDAPRAVNLSRHLHSRLLFLAGGLFAYLLALRLFGSRLLALFAMGFFLLHPRLYGHSFFNAKDIPFLVMFIVTLFLTHRALKRDTLPSFVLLGVGVGLLANLRIMGLMLLAAVPAMRAVDLAFAQGGAERKRVLLTTGGFALAGALTIYALMPYLWPDPAPRAVEWWSTLSDHPYVASDLFRGTFYRSDKFPVEYLPVWFSISAPPFALLLGAVGGGAILVAAARAPRKALRNGGLRFGLLLVGCFALPVFAVMLPGGNIYNGWRQMYFLWAPFALLAAFGLRGLGGALGRRRLRAAVYGAAGAGFAAAVISMALIHPNEQTYFTFFVDRVAPEHLRTQYRIDTWWGIQIRQGLEWLIEHSAQSSGEPSAITANHPSFLLRNTLILPEPARERLANAAPFGIVQGQPLMSWERSARELHRVQVYGSLLTAVESQDDLRRVYESVRGREPALDGAFDVHWIDGALALVMEPCAPAFVESRRWLTVNAFPADLADLPAWRRGETFEPRSFRTAEYGAYFDGKCVASLPFPSYPVAGVAIVQTAQIDGDEAILWRAEFLLEPARRWAEAMEGAAGEPLARSAFDVHLADRALVYVKEPCEQGDAEARFFLHIVPDRAADLPDDRREHGFDNLDFGFFPNGALFEGSCAARIPLPDYPVAGVRTGQHDGEGGVLWSAEFLVDPGRRWADAAAGASGEPVARGAFDVYAADGALVYVKEPCEAADTEARFFLHVVPDRAEDLPDDRREYGFDTWGFAFFSNGALFEGSCAARAALPDYPVSSVRTGQYISGVGEIWSAEFAVKR